MIASLAVPGGVAPATPTPTVSVKLVGGKAVLSRKCAGRGGAAVVGVDGLDRVHVGTVGGAVFRVDPA